MGKRVHKRAQQIFDIITSFKFPWGRGGGEVQEKTFSLRTSSGAVAQTEQRGTN